MRKSRKLTAAPRVTTYLIYLVIYLVVPLTLMAMIFVFFASSAPTAISQSDVGNVVNSDVSDVISNIVKIAALQGDEEELPFEKVLGFNATKIAMSGVPFIFIENGKFSVNVPIMQKVDSYTGSVIADEKDYTLLVDISDKDSPFELRLSLQSNEIEPEKNLDFDLDIKVIKPIKKTFIPISYEVRKLFDDSLVLQEQKGEIIERSEVVFGSAYMPSFVQPGRYLLITKADYKGEVAIASEVFEVKAGVKKAPVASKRLTTIFVMLTTAVILAIIFVVFYVKKSLDVMVKNQPQKLSQIYSEFVRTRKSSEAFEKLNKQSELLGRAYRLGVINKELYEKAKRKIGGVSKRVEVRYGKSRIRASRAEKEYGELKHQLGLLDETYRLKTIRKDRYEKLREKIIRKLKKYDIEV